MKKIKTHFVVLLLGFALPISVTADGTEIGVPEISGFNSENCSLTVKDSTFWSFRSTEKTITGPCDKLVELL